MINEDIRTIRDVCPYKDICKTFSCVKSGDEVIAGCPDEITALAKLEDKELPMEQLKSHFESIIFQYKMGFLPRIYGINNFTGSAYYSPTTFGLNTTPYGLMPKPISYGFYT